MLMFARAVAALTAVIVVVNIAVGAMTAPEFFVPDYGLAAMLSAAAVVPMRSGAAIALTVGLAFALGVFAVALSGQVIAGETNWGLVGLVVADALALVAAIARLRSQSASA